MMYRLIKVFSPVLFLVLSAVAVQAAGFEIGALIKAVELNGQEIEGTIVKYDNRPEIGLLDKTGHYFKLQLKDVKRISGMPGQTVMTGGGTSLKVIKCDMVDGQSVSGGLNSNAIVVIDMGIKGQRNVWVTDYAKYKYVEVVDREVAGSGDGYMKVRLMNGQIIQVPVKKADVHSILFE
jgi:hypothetical protein